MMRKNERIKLLEKGNHEIKGAIAKHATEIYLLECKIKCLETGGHKDKLIDIKLISGYYDCGKQFPSYVQLKYECIKCYRIHTVNSNSKLTKLEENIVREFGYGAWLTDGKR